MGFWEYLYFFGTYIAVIICLIAAGKIWNSEGWKKGVGEFLTLIFFGFAYWLLESHAQVVAPFYLYPGRFPDMIPFFNWGAYGVVPDLDAASHVCARTGTEISATVPLIEMSMTYVFFWTARLLLTPYGFTQDVAKLAIAPFMVGFMALVLDGFLDPVISASHTCTPELLNHPGMPYWNWYADFSLANFWYGIPMFNYAAWYAAPVFLVTVIVLIRWIIELILWLKGVFFGPPYPAPAVMTGLFELVMLLAAAAVYITSLGAEPPYKQAAIIVLAILISLALIVRNAPTYDRNNSFRWEFVVPQIFAFALPLLMLLFSGTFVLADQLLLLLLSVICVVIGIFFALSPYSGTWLVPSALPNQPPTQNRPSRPAGGGAAAGGGT